MKSVTKGAAMLGYASVDVGQIKAYAGQDPDWYNRIWKQYLYAHQDQYPTNNRSQKGYIRLPMDVDEDYRALCSLLNHLQETGQKLQVFEDHDGFTIVGYNELRFILPDNLVHIEKMKSYDDLPAEALQDALGTGLSVIHANPIMSQNDTKAKIACLQSELSAWEEHKRAVENGESEELSDLKAQLDAIQEQIRAKQNALIEQMNEKRQEMERKMAAFKRDLFVLETQIYGLRCYMGEVVSFMKVRDGKPAQDEIPIVIYQKIRYLDEELGRYMALYGFGDHSNDKETFLQVLRSRDDIAELLAPGHKSISVVKISRTGTIKEHSDVVANILKDYAMYHGNQLAILIRNGERLYMTWLDADKIRLSDDNMFFTNTFQQTESVDDDPDDFISERAKAEAFQKEQEKNTHEMLSRWFFFNILQGVLDNGALIKIPEKVSITNVNNPYIVFSNADGWLMTSGYGTFREMLEKSRHIPLKKGDAVLTGTRLTRSCAFNSRDDGRWDNDRGIGEKNRTRGVSLPKMAILPINKVMPAIRVRYTADYCRAIIHYDPQGGPMYKVSEESFSSRQQYAGQEPAYYLPLYTKELTKDCNHTVTWEETIDPERWRWSAESYRKLAPSALFILSHEDPNAVFTVDEHGKKYHHYYNIRNAYEDNAELYHIIFKHAEILGECNHEYYCSVKQNGWSRQYDRQTSYNVNFRVDLSEVLPLPFMCSTWLRDVIQSGRIGDITLCGAKMSVADMMPYLRKMLEYCIEREADEKTLLIKDGGQDYIGQHPAWDAELCDWKITHDVHVMTQMQAKRFLADVAY